jgi:hypothetical protein
MACESVALYESWKPAFNEILEVHALRVFSEEEIKLMGFKQLKALMRKMEDYELSLNTYKKIDPDLVDGYKYVKEELNELEINYYTEVHNQKYSNSSKVVNDIKKCYYLKNGERKTYNQTYIEAEKMILKDYKHKNKANYLELKNITDKLNLEGLLKQRTDELLQLEDAPSKDRAKYYKTLRRQKDPEKEEEKKQQSLIRLNEWRAANPDKLKISQRRAMNRYNEKKQDLTACETDEELALKLTRNAIAKALKKLADAQRYKLKQELKLGLVE